MWYHIYRQNSNGLFQQLGSTLYFEDAEVILARWDSGYIVNYEGAMVTEKNLSL